MKGLYLTRVSKRIADQMLRVGAVAEMGTGGTGQKSMIEGYSYGDKITREQFIDRVAAAGLDSVSFSRMTPDSAVFYLLVPTWLQ